MRLIDIAVATHPGRHREENQDYASYSTLEDSTTASPDMLLAVADGMGGHAGGAVAAKMAVEVLKDAYARSDDTIVTERLRWAFAKANAVMIRRSDQDPDLKGMGTTLTAAVIRESQLFYAHVGDSRGYLFMDGRLKQFTADHSLVADLVERGLIRPEEAESHPQANVITRAIGHSAELVVDSSELAVDPAASFTILLCSDGLYKEVDEGTMATVLSDEPEPQAASSKLVALANDSGGSDNITVLIARVAGLAKKESWLTRLRGH
ncbi:MAG: Stp1/IreP family PP2C-type Ser/Thr phosphatase [Desulfosarcinaceae bacterium]|nr:Stp1/IreP family PP2C-type Ser/Thr phosphatase [Desulfosarcinaceae bacterium]